MGALDDKTVIITGANGGMGMETCVFLLQDGVGHLVMACRTQAKADQARQDLLARVPGAGPDRVSAAGGFDMNDGAAIAAAVDALPADRVHDVVFLQAGGVIFGGAWQAVPWGGQQIERTISQNVVGAHVTLANLRRRGLVAQGARVVIAGGEGARGVPGMIPSPTLSTADELRAYVLQQESVLQFSAQQPFHHWLLLVQLVCAAC